MKPDDTRERSDLDEDRRYGPGELDPAIWIKWSESAMNEGMKWFDVWLQGAQRFWGAGFRAFGQQGMLVPPRGDGMRRASDLPWIPHVEAEVIPLRRKTDRAGDEATRYSMRMPIPWPIGGAKVISLEAIVGRPEGNRTRGEVADRAPPPQNKTQA